LAFKDANIIESLLLESSPPSTDNTPIDSTLPCNLQNQFNITLQKTRKKIERKRQEQ
jgi:hypothetical protein